MRYAKVLFTDTEKSSKRNDFSRSSYFLFAFSQAGEAQETRRGVG